MRDRWGAGGGGRGWILSCVSLKQETGAVLAVPELRALPDQLALLLSPCAEVRCTSEASSSVRGEKKNQKKIK